MVRKARRGAAVAPLLPQALSGFRSARLRLRLALPQLSGMRTARVPLRLALPQALLYPLGSPSAAPHPATAARATVYYHADTENALGMWRIALTAPSSLKITETTSKRHETCRSRFSLR